MVVPKRGVSRALGRGWALPLKPLGASKGENGQKKKTLFRVGPFGKRRRPFSGSDQKLFTPKCDKEVSHTNKVQKL
jgi:hypothetical protein